MTTHEPKHESKHLRRVREMQESREAVFTAGQKGQSNAASRAARKPGSGNLKKGNAERVRTR